MRLIEWFLKFNRFMNYRSIFFAGFLIDFVSGPVSSGFTSAVALIILTSQVKDVLGIKASGSTFVTTWKSIFEDIHNTKAWDAMMGIVCIAVLLILRVRYTFKQARIQVEGSPLPQCSVFLTNIKLMNLSWVAPFNKILDPPLHLNMNKNIRSYFVLNKYGIIVWILDYWYNKNWTYR